MRNRRLVKVAAVLCGLALLAAACGDDDDESSATTPTTRPPTDDGGGEGGGELAGAKGTTPAPETTDAVDGVPGPDGRARRGSRHRPRRHLRLRPRVLRQHDHHRPGGPGRRRRRHRPRRARSSTSPRAARSAAPTPTASRSSRPAPTSTTRASPAPPTCPATASRSSAPTPCRSTATTTASTPSRRRSRAVEASEEFHDMPNDPVDGRAGRRRRPHDRHAAAGDRQPRLPRPTGDRRRPDGHRRDQRGRRLRRHRTSCSSRATPATPPPTPPSRRSPAELQQNVDAIIGAASSSVSASVIDQITDGRRDAVLARPTRRSSSRTTTTRACTSASARPTSSRARCWPRSSPRTATPSLVILNFDDDYGNGLAEDLAAIVRRPAAARWSTRSPTTRRRRRSTPRSQQAQAADADAIALIGFDETSRLLVALVEQGVGPQRHPDLPGRRQHRQRPRRALRRRRVVQLEHHLRSERAPAPAGALPRPGLASAYLALARVPR